MRLRYKKWAKPYLHTHQEIAITNLEEQKEQIINILAQPNLFLEIGGGRGDFIVKLSQKNLDKIFVMVEKNENAAAVAARKVVEAELTNVYVIVSDVFHLIHFIKDETIAGIFLNFSDPWPKARHEKRRLTYDLALKEYRRILSNGGKVALKTDNPDFYTYSLAKFREYNWVIENNSYNYRGFAEFDAETEYEAKFRAEGKPICRLVARKGENTYAIN